MLHSVLVDTGLPPRSYLREQFCDMLQGYCLSPAVPALEFAELVREREARLVKTQASSNIDVSRGWNSGGRRALRCSTLPPASV